MLINYNNSIKRKKTERGETEIRSEKLFFHEL